MIPSGSGGDYYVFEKMVYRTVLKTVLISGVNAYSFTYADVVRHEPLLNFCQIGSQFSKKIAKLKRFAKILAKTTADLAKNQQNAIRIALEKRKRRHFRALTNKPIDLVG